MATNVDDFKAAVGYVQGLPKDGKVQPSNSAKLAFYALYKQATKGPNSDPAPSRFKMVERAKWDAWKKLGNISKDEAKKLYIEVLAKVDPNWKINHEKLRSKL